MVSMLQPKKLLTLAEAVHLVLCLLTFACAERLPGESHCRKLQDGLGPSAGDVPLDDDAYACPAESESNRLIKSEVVSGEEKKMDVIHVAIVVCRDRSEMALTFLKSLLLTTQHFLHVYVVAEDHQSEIISGVVANWEATKKRWVVFEFLDLYFPESANPLEWKNLGRPCATQRLFFPERLKETDALIYMDIDVIVLKPIEMLWEHFHKFNSTQVAALSFEHYFSEGWYASHAKHPFYEPFGLNAGIMLMNLTRMRDLSWLADIITIQRDFRNSIPWGDQDILNIYFHRHREMLFVLSCLWNYRTDHCFYINRERKDVCAEALREGIAILHGNKEIFRNNRHPEMKCFYEAVRRYDFQGNFKNYVVEEVRKSLIELVVMKGEYYCTKIAEATVEMFAKAETQS